jgi:Spy/CpxP family protein refolding chaperone
MRSIKNKIMLILILAFMAGTVLNAQPFMNKFRGIPGLSEDQKAQIQKLRVSHLKDIQVIKNQIGENRAHYKTLMTSENPDMNAINKNIEEFGGLRTQLLKKQAAHLQDVRKLLTEEQRLIFDQQQAERSNQQGTRSGFIGRNRHMGSTASNQHHKNMQENSGGQQ